MIRALLLSSLLIATSSAIAKAEQPDLPPREAVIAAIDDDPTVVAARAAIRGEYAQRDRLNLGPHEFAVRLGTQQRKATDPLERYQEWDVALERPLRWASKARVDAELGEQGVLVAQEALADARHEVARRLLKGWFVWLRERAQMRALEEQLTTLERQRDVVDRRVRVGDAPRQELSLAEASLLQAEGALAQARTRYDVAQGELRARFPKLPLSDAVVLPVPQPMPESLESWRSQTLEHNHELALARAEGKRARLVAARARTDLVPDPTIGIRYVQERSGAERIVGLTFSIPLPGGGRAAASSSALAAADAAAQREAGVTRKLEAEIAGNYASARGAFASWERLAAAAERLRANAASIERGYALGGMPLSEVLLARRQALEAAIAAAIAQHEAQEARYRLMLDAHLLWLMDDPA